MNESFTLRFKRGSHDWRVQSLVSAGLVFDEPDAPARRLTLDFDTPSPVVEHRLDRIRELQGWGPWHFELRPFLHDGRLGFRGVHEHALPPGDYQVKLRIQDLTIRDVWVRFRIPANGSAQVDVPVARDDRRVSPDLEDVDNQIARLLDVHGPLDGAETCRDWLTQSGARATRKACLLNILAQLRVTPSRSAPLIAETTRVFQVRDDRIYAEVDPAMYIRVRTLALDEAELKFYAEGEPHAPVHLELLDALPSGSGPHTHRLESYRAEGPSSQPALQIVFAVPKVAGVQACFAEFDIDLGNPLQDVAGFAIHIGELLDSKPTNHLDLGPKLTRARDFLYYSVVHA